MSGRFCTDPLAQLDHAFCSNSACVLLDFAWYCLYFASEYERRPYILTPTVLTFYSKSWLLTKVTKKIQIFFITVIKALIFGKLLRHGHEDSLSPFAIFLPSRGQRRPSPFFLNFSTPTTLNCSRRTRCLSYCTTFFWAVEVPRRFSDVLQFADCLPPDQVGLFLLKKSVIIRNDIFFE